VFVVCFDNHLRLVSGLTESASEVVDRLQQCSDGNRHVPELGPREDRDLGPAVYDAIYYPITEKLAGEAGRRALLLFSHGEDNSSSHDMMILARRNKEDHHAPAYGGRKGNTG